MTHLISSSFCVHHLALLILIAVPKITLSQEATSVLDKIQQLSREDWWYNQDYDWYQDNIPFFECSDKDITTTWYYHVVVMSLSEHSKNGMLSWYQS